MMKSLEICRLESEVSPCGVLETQDILDITVTPDGQEVCFCDTGGKLWTWSLKNHQLLRKQRLGSGVTSVDYSPDGRSLLTAHEDGSIEIRDRYTLVSAHKYSAHANRVSLARFNPADADTIASASGGQSSTGGRFGETLLYSLTSRMQMRKLPATDRTVAIAWSSDGHRLATAGWDHCVRICDLAMTTAISEVRTDSSVYAVAFTRCNDMLWVGEHFGILSKIIAAPASPSLSVQFESLVTNVIDLDDVVFVTTATKGVFLCNSRELSILERIELQGPCLGARRVYATNSIVFTNGPTMMQVLL